MKYDEIYIWRIAKQALDNKKAKDDLSSNSPQQMKVMISHVRTVLEAKDQIDKLPNAQMELKL